MELARLLKDDYSELIEFNLEQDSIRYAQVLIDQMKERNENEVLIFEAMSNL